MVVEQFCKSSIFLLDALHTHTHTNMRTHTRTHTDKEKWTDVLVVYNRVTKVVTSDEQLDCR